MQKLIGIILIAFNLIYSNLVFADSDMFRPFEQDLDYKEHKLQGYNLQPDLPDWWFRECGNANHHCVGIYVPPGPRTSFAPPSLLNEHR